MGSTTLLPQFDLLTEATGGVQHLRKLILRLAIMGKLVSQDCSDEPADDFVERIATFKQQCGRNGRTRLPARRVTAQECLWTIPQNWSWVRFSDVTVCRDGERVPLSSEVREGRKGPYDYYGASGIIDHVDSYLFDKPLLLIGEDGANLVRRSSPIAFVAEGKYWVNNHAHVIDGISLDCLRYLELFINAIDLKRYVTGTAQPKMNQAKMNSIPVAFPPENEQKRIVLRANQLMSLCDDLESRQKRRGEVRMRLNDAALDRLVMASDPAEFAAAWQRVRDNFDLLYAVPENVAKLRQAILQLAVQGKLVAQDPEDEPASTVLEQIQTEWGDGKPTPVASVEGPFPLPRGWVWATFPALGTFGRGKSRHRPRNDKKLFRDGHFPLVQTGDVARSNGIITTYTGLYNEVGLAQSRVWPKGTMCITIAANIADSGLLGFDACIPDSVVGFIPHKPFDDARFFEYFMRTAKERLEQYAPSTAQKNINVSILEKVQVPVPPLEEIRRIVSRVDQLMALCDDLETKLKHQHDHADRLAQAVVNAVMNRKTPDGCQGKGHPAQATLGPVPALENC
jgi:type I restriction enzyme S subunit